MMEEQVPLLRQALSGDKSEGGYFPWGLIGVERTADPSATLGMTKGRDGFDLCDGYWDRQNSSSTALPRERHES
jgi:hypothetical protein